MLPVTHQAGNQGGAPMQAIPSPLDGANPIDGQGHLFKTYLDIARKKDDAIANRWKEGADGIILFTGLFSAALAALLTLSVQDLRPNSTDISAAYLANIYQLLATDRDGSRVFISSTLPLPSSDFSVPKHAVWVNSLWFLSLAMSITCALSATLVQRWARRYIKVTQSPHSPRKQARIRAFFAEGLHNFHVRWVVELLPTLLHLSVFLFFAGFSVFLFNLNRTVFKAVIWWVGLCGVAYLCITFMPLFRHDSPYNSPLSFLFPHIWAFILYGYSKILQQLTSRGGFSYESRVYYLSLEERYRDRLHDSVRKTAEKFVQGLPSEIAGLALVWTLKSFCRDQDPDNKQEKFVEGIPAFCKSVAVPNSDGGLEIPHAEKISEALVGFVHHTSTSDLDAETKRRRFLTCTDAMDEASLPITGPILRRIIYKDWDELLGSVDFAEFLMTRTTKYSDPKALHQSKWVIAAAIRATAQEPKSSWFQLATNHLHIEQDVLEDYQRNGDSALLANCIDICRRTIEAYSSHDWPISARWPSKCLDIVSKLDAQDTLPKLKRDFCNLWNELVARAGDSKNSRMAALAIFLLRHTRRIYIDMHRDTDVAPTQFDTTTDDYAKVLFSSSSYPLCNNPDHGHMLQSSTRHERPFTLTLPLPPLSPIMTPF